jgi:glycine/D-amino acid oxidase-like deaminating enzyme
MDVVIIGGGIVGTAAAAFLSEAGVRVTLVDGDGLASAASGANSGVVQHPFDPVLAALYRATLAGYRELSAAGIGFRLGAEPAGLLYVSSDDRVVRAVDGSLAASFPELPRDVIGGDVLARVEPALADDLWACRVGIGYPVQPAASTYAYAGIAERLGATIRLGRPARLLTEGDAVTGVVVDGRTIAADAVLVAAGPWSPAIVDPTGRWAPIQPHWGVVVETLLPDGPTHVLEEAEIGSAIGSDAPEPANPDDSDPGDAGDLVDFTLVPLDGIASVGSTFLAQRPDPSAWVEPILEHAARFVPAVAEAPIRGVRSCARPYSRDGRPLVGQVHGRPGLYVCAGHGPWGISTGPATARLVVDAILGRSPAIPPELDLGRFGPVPVSR